MAPVWTTACPDWEERIVARESLVPFAPLFPDEAAAALAVFKSLKMVGVPRRDGRPGWATFGEACEPFVFDFVEAIFGAYDPESGVRLISDFMMLISKKNGKSTIAAAIMLTALIRNWRELAELIILAPTQKIALNSFRPASAMVKADPQLNAQMHIIANQRTIRHRETQAELKVIAADAGTVGGVQAGFVLVDELWLFGKRPNAEAMMEEATGGLASRPEGFVVYLSTHSDEPPAGIFKSKLAYFRDVRDGVIEDPRSFSMLYEWPEAMLESQAYLKPENFYVTNPNMGRSVTADFITTKLRRAKGGEVDEDGDTGSIQIVLAKYLNVEIGLRLHRDRWRGADYWEIRGSEILRDLDHFLSLCEVAVVGIDGGGLDDLFGFCVAGRHKRTKVWIYWHRGFAHRKVLELRKEIAPALMDFAASGDLVFWGAKGVTERDMARLLAAEADDEASDLVRPEEDADEDVAQIVALCERVRDSGLMPEDGGIGVDPAAIGTLVDALVAAGFTLVDGGHGDVATVSQSATNLHSAYTTLHRKLEAGTAAHGGLPIMAWNVGNAKAILRGNSVSITKAESGKAKIDLLVATAVATKLLEQNPASVESFVYSERGMLVL